MSDNVETFEFSGEQYVRLSSYLQQVADHQTLRAEADGLRAENATLKGALKLCFQTTAPLLDIQLAQQQVRQRGTAQQQHPNQSWQLQKVSGVSIKDNTSAGTVKVQVYRIQRSSTAGNEQTPQESAAAADTQPLFRPYDALQLASQHHLWNQAKVEQYYTLVSTATLPHCEDCMHDSVRKYIAGLCQELLLPLA